MRLGATEPQVSNREAPDLAALLPPANTPDNMVKPVTEPEPEQLASHPAVDPGEIPSARAEQKDSDPITEPSEEVIAAPATTETIEVASIPP